MNGNAQEKKSCGSCCTLLVSMGFFLLIYWAIFQPHQIRATVDHAELSNLTVSSATGSASSSVSVSYHVVANLSLYNPSKRVNIYYDALYAELNYRGALLTNSNSPAASGASPLEFYQRRKTAQAVRFELDGNGVAVPGDVAAQLESDAKAAARPLGLELKVYVKVRYVFGSIKIRRKPTVTCQLSFPAPSTPGGTSAVVSSGERCSVKHG